MSSPLFNKHTLLHIFYPGTLWDKNHYPCFQDAETAISKSQSLINCKVNDYASTEGQNPLGCESTPDTYSLCLLQQPGPQRSCELSEWVSPGPPKLPLTPPSAPVVSSSPENDSSLPAFAPTVSLACCLPSLFQVWYLPSPQVPFPRKAPIQPFLRGFSLISKFLLVSFKAVIWLENILCLSSRMYVPVDRHPVCCSMTITHWSWFLSLLNTKQDG